jgi:hypothetical protein
MFSFFGFQTKTNIGAADEDQKPVEGEDSSDLPPLFPAQNSIQRLSSTHPKPSSSSATTTTTTHPIFRVDSPDHQEENDDDDDDDDDDDEMPDIDQLEIDALSLPHSTRIKPPKPRKKVRLMPGFSQLDWAKLKSSGANLRVCCFFANHLSPPPLLSFTRQNYPRRKRKEKILHKTN